jgi:mevalonate kinase
MADQIVSASAPGKVILFGEHAVVYGYPAIAVPILQLEARVTVKDLRGNKPDGYIQIDAPDIKLSTTLHKLPLDHPLSLAIRGVLVYLEMVNPPALRLHITSTIPVAAGLGSGAAVSVAIIRAVCQYFKKPLPPEIISGLAYEVEKSHHGRPSGIDNTVITYAQPIYFQREKPFEILPPREPFTLVIADTGISSPTARAVAGVKDRHDQNPERYQLMFEEISLIAVQAREIILHGSIHDAGPLMYRNHELLRDMGVSSDPLDLLVQAARNAGALGAKLSGGGLGGNMIALAGGPGDVERISKALMASGAARCFSTTIMAEKTGRSG